MATGWAGDGAVQDQIDATVEDAISRVQSQLPQGSPVRFAQKPATALLPLSEPDASRLVAAAALAIPDLAGIDLLGILQRHPRRLPSAGLRDGRQVDVELREILRGAYPRGVPTHLGHEPGRHANPLCHTFEDRRDAAWMWRIANLISANQPAKYRPFTDLRMVEPDS